MKPFEQTLHARTETMLIATLGAEPFAAARAEGSRLQLADAAGLTSALGLSSAA